MTKEFNSREIRLIAGLGNPEEEYSATYHNVGYRALQYLAEGEKPFSPSKKTFLYKKEGKRIFILPRVAMNHSGSAIKEALTFFRIKPSSLLLIHDDSDLPIGTFRLGFSRGAAGHKGVISVIKNVKTNEFWRIRIGIRPDHEKKRIKAGAFVLKTISRDHERLIQKVFKEIHKLLTDFPGVASA